MKKILVMKNVFILSFVFFVLTLTGVAQNAESMLFSKKYIKKSVIKVTIWQLENPKHDPCDWTKGAFYAGVFAAWETPTLLWICDNLRN